VRLIAFRNDGWEFLSRSWSERGDLRDTALGGLNNIYVSSKKNHTTFDTYEYPTNGSSAIIGGSRQKFKINYIAATRKSQKVPSRHGRSSHVLRPLYGQMYAHRHFHKTRGSTPPTRCLKGRPDPHLSTEVHNEAAPPPQSQQISATKPQLVRERASCVTPINCLPRNCEKLQRVMSTALFRFSAHPRVAGWIGCKKALD